MTKALAATVRRTTEQMRGRTLDAAIIDGHQPRQNARAGLIGGMESAAGFAGPAVGS